MGCGPAGSKGVMRIIIDCYLEEGGEARDPGRGRGGSPVSPTFNCSSTRSFPRYCVLLLSRKSVARGL
jgi:hypothetical protein